MGEQEGGNRMEQEGAGGRGMRKKFNYLRSALLSPWLG
jgi:hypothetical protein